MARTSIRLCVVALWACGGPSPHPPSAVAVAEPSSVCVADGHRTVVLLDGRQSAQRLTLVPETDPPGLAPLRFTWTLRGDSFEIVDGDLESEQLSVTLAGERPLHVRLRVENEGGGRSETEITVGVAFTEETPPAFECLSDSECGPCRRCVERVCEVVP